ncbi:ECF-type sigma factor [Blastopirellula sp. J2-11]|uniref:ECF-type sigma factor n=1 Tax=Blastopirellula sp. J2-11 TaxID=2943192 RepID=UPI0021C96201|nr:ECF-type sigma factor [Blastopirellula sp. J2-11]UUO08610.1 ECF-type sigma factor [Blastopirellula sp. J2-11]
MSESQSILTDERLAMLLETASTDANVTDEMIALIYGRLRKLAHGLLSRESPGQSLQTTDLVHEFYLRFADDQTKWENRGHLFGSAARSMRQILVNRATRRKRLKRGGGQRNLDIDLETLAISHPDDLLVDLDLALQRLAEAAPRKAEMVDLRWFGGLSIEEIAVALSLSTATVKRDLRFARSWLYREICDASK